jgi:hypothetical protein
VGPNPGFGAWSPFSAGIIMRQCGPLTFYSNPFILIV